MMRVAKTRPKCPTFAKKFFFCGFNANPWIKTIMVYKHDVILMSSDTLIGPPESYTEFKSVTD